MSLAPAIPAGGEPPVAELEAVLGQLLPALARLREVAADQRAAVAAGDLRGLLALTAEQEALAARLARLERRRLGLQARRGAEPGLEDGPVSARADPLAVLVAEIGASVAELRAEHERAATTLGAAAEVARRARSFLERLGGAQPAYTAPPARPRPRAPAGVPEASRDGAGDR